VSVGGDAAGVRRPALGRRGARRSVLPPFNGLPKARTRNLTYQYLKLQVPEVLGGGEPNTFCCAYLISSCTRAGPDRITARRAQPAAAGLRRRKAETHQEANDWIFYQKLEPYRLAAWRSPG